MSGLYKSDRYLYYSFYFRTLVIVGSESRDAHSTCIKIGSGSVLQEKYGSGSGQVNIIPNTNIDAAGVGKFVEFITQKEALNPVFHVIFYLSPFSL